MKQTSISVVITTLGGNEFTFADSVSPGLGVAALYALERGQDVIGTAEGSKIIVPYHAIDNAVVTMSTETAEDPEDDTCVVEEADTTSDSDTTPGEP